MKSSGCANSNNHHLLFRLHHLLFRLSLHHHLLYLLLDTVPSRRNANDNVRKRPRRLQQLFLLHRLPPLLHRLPPFLHRLPLLLHRLQLRHDHHSFLRLPQAAEPFTSSMTRTLKAFPKMSLEAPSTTSPPTATTTTTSLSTPPTAYTQHLNKYNK